MVLLFYVPKYKSASKKDECCLQSPTIGPTFQSGTEKPFKMVSLISYIVEGLLLSSSNPDTGAKKHACSRRLMTTTNFLGEGDNNLPSPISYIV